GYARGVMPGPRIGSRVASCVGLSEVLFALGFAWLLLSEAPAPIQFVGGALILVGVVLVRLDGGAPRASGRQSTRGPRPKRRVRKARVTSETAETRVARAP